MTFCSPKYSLFVLIIFLFLFAACAGTQVPDSPEVPAVPEQIGGNGTDSAVESGDDADSPATSVAGGALRSWDELDKAVSKISRRKLDSIDDLVTALDELADTDWEKTRAVWQWVTHNIAYDTDSYFSGNYPSTDPGTVFASGQSICDGYSGLFADIAGRLGLEAVAVSGYGKGYGYSPGQADPGGSNHAWNAVKIDGRWYLFDATWGAGHVNGRRFEWKYNEFFFATPPQQFIFSHFPEDPGFQLIPEPVSRRTFFALPNLKAPAFNAGADPDEVVQAVLSGREVSVPQFYNSKVSARFTDFPLTGTLQAGRHYELVLETDSLFAMYSNNRDSSDILRAENGRVTISGSWKRGDLTIFLSPPGDRDPYGANYEGFVTFRVE